MNRNFSAALLVAGSVLSASALAQGYVGAAIGQSRADIDCSGTASCDRTDTASRLSVGTMISPALGFELGYFNNGKARASGVEPTIGALTGSVKTEGVAGYVVGVVPMDKFMLYGKLGVASTKMKLDARVTATNASYSTSERHTDVAFAVGAGYQIATMVVARLEFDRVRGKILGEKSNVDAVTLGLTFGF